MDQRLLHFVAFHVASLFSTEVDNEKALELDNNIVRETSKMNFTYILTVESQMNSGIKLETGIC